MCEEGGGEGDRSLDELFHCAPNIPHYAGNKAVGVMKARRGERVHLGEGKRGGGGGGGNDVQSTPPHHCLPHYCPPHTHFCLLCRRVMCSRWSR